MEMIFIAVVLFVVGCVVGYLFQKSKSMAILAQLSQREIETERSGREIAQLKSELGLNIVKQNELNEVIGAQNSEIAILKTNLQHKCNEVAQRNDSIANLGIEIDKRESELIDLRRGNTSLLEKNRALEESKEEQKRIFEESEKQLHRVFENSANKIFEDKQNSFSKTSKEQIKSLLEPFGKSIDEFKKEIKSNYIDQSTKSASLSTELKNLMDLNRQLSDDANNLTKALKGEKNNKLQGNWGEMILETILQNSGLEKDVHYFTQESMKSDEGRSLRPDVIIRYPDDREVIIDSKVSLVAYSRYIAAESDIEREMAMTEHIKSIKSHIDLLSDKKYEQKEKSLDFVMMFMPIEAAYIVALNSDISLWDYAYKRRIILITPTHLITALKLVYDLWTRDTQNKNVLQIVDRANKLYDKVDVFVGYMNSVDDSLAKSRVNFDKAMGAFSTGNGNILRQVQGLQKLGIKGTKSKSNIELGD